MNGSEKILNKKQHQNLSFLFEQFLEKKDILLLVLEN